MSLSPLRSEKKCRFRCRLYLIISSVFSFPLFDPLDDIPVVGSSEEAGARLLSETDTLDIAIAKLKAVIDINKLMRKVGDKTSGPDWQELVNKKTHHSITEHRVQDIERLERVHSEFVSRCYQSWATRVREALYTRAAISSDLAELRKTRERIVDREKQLASLKPLSATKKSARELATQMAHEIRLYKQVKPDVDDAINRLAPQPRQTDIREHDGYLTFSWNPTKRRNRILSDEELSHELVKEISVPSLLVKGDVLPSRENLLASISHLREQTAFTDGVGNKRKMLELTETEIRVSKLLFGNENDSQLMDIMQQVAMESFCERGNFLTGAPETKYPFVMQSFANSVLHMDEKRASAFVKDPVYGPMAAERAAIESKAAKGTWTAVKEEAKRLKALGLSLPPVKRDVQFRVEINHSYVAPSIIRGSTEKPLDSKEAAWISASMRPSPGADNVYTVIDSNVADRALTAYFKRTCITEARLEWMFNGLSFPEIKRYLHPASREKLLKELCSAPDAAIYPDCFESREQSFNERSRMVATRDSHKYGTSVAAKYDDLLIRADTSADDILALVEQGAFDGSNQENIYIRATSHLLGCDEEASRSSSVGASRLDALSLASPPLSPSAFHEEEDKHHPDHDESHAQATEEDMLAFVLDECDRLQEEEEAKVDDAKKPAPIGFNAYMRAPGERAPSGLGLGGVPGDGKRNTSKMDKTQGFNPDASSSTLPSSVARPLKSTRKRSREDLDSYESEGLASDSEEEDEEIKARYREGKLVNTASSVRSTLSRDDRPARLPSHIARAVKDADQEEDDAFSASGMRLAREQDEQQEKRARKRLRRVADILDTESEKDKKTYEDDTVDAASEGQDEVEQDDATLPDGDEELPPVPEDEGDEGDTSAPMQDEVDAAPQDQDKSVGMQDDEEDPFPDPPRIGHIPNTIGTL